MLSSFSFSFLFQWVLIVIAKRYCQLFTTMPENDLRAKIGNSVLFNPMPKHDMKYPLFRTP